MWELLTTPDAWFQLLMLSVLEIVLGIDNLVFLSIISGRLPESQRAIARRLGLIAALVMRILLLLSLSWVISLKTPLFTFIRPWNGHDLVLFTGGVFLIWKSVKEIIHDTSAAPHEGSHESHLAKHPSFLSAILTIGLLDIVFSLDSVITAVGIADHIPVMVAAILLAVGVMLIFVNYVADFIETYPGIKMLALAFLVLIGGVLILSSFGYDLPKGYLYTAMAFSFAVELLNIRVQSLKGDTPKAP